MVKINEENSDSCPLVALFLFDVLTPIRKLYGVASRETFRSFRKEGLPVYKVSGLGLCVRPSEFKQYLNDTSTLE